MQIELNDTDLSELIRRTVLATIAELEQRRADAQGRLAYTEAEAAALLGMKQMALRDERVRGRIQTSYVAGRRPRYTLADLVEYLAQGKTRDDFGAHNKIR